MDINRIYLFLLTVLTNFSVEIFAEDFQNVDTTTMIVTSTTIDAPTVASKVLPEEGLKNLTHAHKAILKAAQTTWEPVPEPAYKFGFSPRKRPRCCRLVRDKPIRNVQGRQIKCRNGSVMFKDEKGIRRRRCRRRRRCKRRCKKHFKSSAWSIMESIMEGMDYFLPKMQFKFHTGTLIFGTKFFSGLVPFMHAKIKMVRLFYSMFEPLLDGVLDVLDFGRSSFRTLTGGDDDDDDEDSDEGNSQKTDEDEEKVEENEEEESDSNGKDEEDDDEDEDEDDEEDYDDDGGGFGDFLSAKTDVNKSDQDDEGYNSADQADEDYGIDSDWADEENNDDEEYFYEDEVKLLIPRPPKRKLRPVRVPFKPTRPSIPVITPPNDLDTTAESAEMINDSSQVAISNFLNKLRESGNFTAYHGQIPDLDNMIANKLPMLGEKDKNKVGGLQGLLKPNKDKKPGMGLLGAMGGGGGLGGMGGGIGGGGNSGEDDDGDDSSGAAGVWTQGDKNVLKPSIFNKIKNKDKGQDEMFTSFQAFFTALADAFDTYFEATY